MAELISAVIAAAASLVGEVAAALSAVEEGAGSETGGTDSAASSSSSASADSEGSEAGSSGGSQPPGAEGDDTEDGAEVSPSWTVRTSEAKQVGPRHLEIEVEVIGPGGSEAPAASKPPDSPESAPEVHRARRPPAGAPDDRPTPGAPDESGRAGAVSNPRDDPTAAGPPDEPYDPSKETPNSIETPADYRRHAIRPIFDEADRAHEKLRKDLTDWVQDDPTWWKPLAGAYLQTELDLLQLAWSSAYGMTAPLELGEGAAKETGWGVAEDALRATEVLGGGGKGTAGKKAGQLAVKHGGPLVNKVVGKAKGVVDSLSKVRKSNKYPGFERLTPALRRTAEKAATRLGKQLGIPIRGDRVLSAPWIGKGALKSGKDLPSTSEGWLRNNKSFWKAFKENFPDDFKLLGKGKTVTKKLAEKYGWDKKYVGDKLVHHHIDNGTLVTAIPESLHQSLYKAVHRAATVVGSP